ncbi:hypothetical protein CVT24_009114, partial [Panaeolus cyanescens]
KAIHSHLQNFASSTVIRNLNFPIIPIAQRPAQVKQPPFVTRLFLSLSRYLAILRIAIELVAQHIPQVQAYMAPIGAAAAAVSQAHAQQGPAAGSTNFAPQVVAQPQTQIPAPVTNPFLDPIGYQQTTAPPGAANGTGAGIPNNLSHTLPTTQPLHLSTKHNQQTSDNLECLIPGCGQPVHVDAKGLKTSEYCSMRHRDPADRRHLLPPYREAVLSGLRPPCIMCLTLPQSETDYFCSRACREESMNKQQEYEVVSDPE